MMPIKVILVILVLVKEIGHLQENEDGSHKNDKAEMHNLGQKRENKMAAKEGLMRSNQGENRNIGENRVLPPIPGLINTTEPQVGQPPQINNNHKDAESHTRMTNVPDLGHRTMTKGVVPHVIDPPHSSLKVGTTPEAARENKRSNVNKVGTENVQFPEDAKTTLTTGAGLKIKKVLQNSKAGARVGIDKNFVLIVVDLNVKWQNATFLKRWKCHSIHVHFVQPNSCTEQRPIAKSFRITGPP
jgi:hypothetical protein